MKDLGPLHTILGNSLLQIKSSESPQLPSVRGAAVTACLCLSRGFWEEALGKPIRVSDTGRLAETCSKSQREHVRSVFTALHSVAELESGGGLHPGKNTAFGLRQIRGKPCPGLLLPCDLGQVTWSLLDGLLRQEMTTRPKIRQL